MNFQPAKLIENARLQGLSGRRIKIDAKFLLITSILQRCYKKYLSLFLEKHLTPSYLRTPKNSYAIY